MHNEASLLYKTTKKFHSDTYSRMSKLRATAASQGIKELADIVYALKQSVKLIEDTRKELNQVSEIIQKACCALYAQESQAGPTGPIRTEYCTATPVFKMSVTLPHHTRDKEKYEALMMALGIDEMLWKVDTEAGEKPAVAINFLGFSDLITAYAREGKPLPPGIDQDYMFPQYSLTIRPRKEVDAD